MSPDERRADLTDVTLRLLRVHGRDVTTRQIAEAAGIAEGTVFRAFASKEELLDAAISRAFEPGDLVTRLEEIDRDLPLRERLVTLVAIMQQRFRATFGLMQKMGLVRPPTHLHDAEGAAAWRQRLEGLLGRRRRRRRRPARRTSRPLHPRAAPADLRGQPRAHRRRSSAHPRRDRRHHPARTPEERPMLIRLLRERLAPYKLWLTIVVVLQFIGVVAMLYLPTLNADIIDNGVVTGDTGYILRIGAIMLGVSLVQIVCSVTAVWFGARTAMGFGRDVRAALFHRVGSFSTKEVQHFGAPSLITRSTNDVQQVQMLVLMACTIAVSSPIMMVGGVIMALREDMGLGWILAVVVPALFVCVGFVVSRMVPNFRKMQARIDEINRVLREQITGIRVVRAFVREPYETQPLRRRPTPTSPTSPCGPAGGWPPCSRW